MSTTTRDPRLAAAAPARDSAEAIAEARVHLAAALRLATIHELDEGIDNHFTVQVPGQPGKYLILPFGIHWSEARASDMIVFDEEGATLEGRGKVEISARCIHAPIHRLTGAQAVFHTHQPWATALNMLKDNRLLPASQNALFLMPRIAYDDTYSGLAHSIAEGERLAGLLTGGKTIAFLKNHGVLVTGNTIAQAYSRLYRVERACRLHMLALGTGKPLEVLSDEMVKQVFTPNPQDSHSRAERERLFFEAMMKVADRELPGYAK
jgi:ribulose-5-phosphate 4-epimerase/fuculose-1-phosphate aldolase